MTDVSGSPFGRSNGTTRAASEVEVPEITRELAGLRREVLEARNLSIKTDNLLKTFHIELKAIATKQDGYERKHFIGHVAAYAVIGLLAAGGALLAVNLAVDSSREEADKLLVEAQESAARAEVAEKEATGILATRDAAAADAKAAYELLRSTTRTEQERGLERLSSVQLVKLDALSRSILETEAETLRRTFADEAYEAGMALYHRSRLRDAVVELEKFRQYADPLPADYRADDRAQSNYYLGAAYNQIGEHEQAAQRLSGYFDTRPSGDAAAYASLLLGDSLQNLGKQADAKLAFERGLELGGGARGSTLRERIQALETR